MFVRAFSGTATFHFIIKKTQTGVANCRPLTGNTCIAVCSMELSTPIRVHRMRGIALKDPKFCFVCFRSNRDQ